MKYLDGTTYIASDALLPRRESSPLADGSVEDGAEQAAATAGTGEHRFPTVPKLRRRLIPRIPAPYRDTLTPPRADSSLDTLPRVVSAKTHNEQQARRAAFMVLTVGLVLGICTALLRFASSH